jgi:hypothetical protein
VLNGAGVVHPFNTPPICFENSYALEISLVFGKQLYDLEEESGEFIIELILSLGNLGKL